MAGVAVLQISRRDLDDPTLSLLNQILVALANEVNRLAGIPGTIAVGANLNLQGNNITSVGKIFPKATLTVTGSKGGNAALASLIAQLVNLGLVIDKTT